MAFFDLFNKKKQEDFPARTDTVYSEKEYHEQTVNYDSIYHPVLFSQTYDIDVICGNRRDVWDRNYVVPQWWSLSCQYIHRIWRESNDINSDKIKSPKKFFETIESLENSLSEYTQYKFKCFDYYYEMNLYNTKKADIVNRFIERSFRDEFRRSLELKTPSGRIDRVEHWFMIMNYYSQYMPAESRTVLSDVYVKWLNEFKAIAEKGRFDGI